MTGWQDGAACRGADGSLWFPGRGENDKALAAKAICVGCPVREQCLEDALARGERQGILGGAGPRVRRPMSMAYALRPHDWRADCSCRWCRRVDKHFVRIGTPHVDVDGQLRLRRTDGGPVVTNGPGVRHGKRSTYARGDRCPACSFAVSKAGLALAGHGVDVEAWWRRWFGVHWLGVEAATVDERDRVLDLARRWAELMPDVELAQEVA